MIPLTLSWKNVAPLVSQPWWNLTKSARSNPDCDGVFIGGCKKACAEAPYCSLHYESIDGEVYAIAQGSLVVGGFNATDEKRNQHYRNTPTVGRIPNGATLERWGGIDRCWFRANDTLAAQTTELKPRLMFQSH